MVISALEKNKTGTWVGTACTGELGLQLRLGSVGSNKKPKTVVT